MERITYKVSAIIAYQITLQTSASNSSTKLSKHTLKLVKLTLDIKRWDWPNDPFITGTLFSKRKKKIVGIRFRTLVSTLYRQNLLGTLLFKARVDCTLFL